MQKKTVNPEVQQFILDGAELASSLDSLDLSEDRQDMLNAVLQARAQYAILLTRRKDLQATAAEEAWLDFMLDCLQARLKFLESRIWGNNLVIRIPPGSDPGLEMIH
jgi:hypothetical protein